MERILHNYLLFVGCKKNDIDVVYTMWANLNKTANMDVGQVGFLNHKEVIICVCVCVCVYVCGCMCV